MKVTRLALAAVLAGTGCVHQSVPDPAPQFANRVESSAPISTKFLSPVESANTREVADSAQSTIPLDRPITFEQAKEIANRQSPKLAEIRANLAIASAREEVAFAAFLPSASMNYSFQGFSNNVGYVGTDASGRFPVLPVRGFGPGNQDFQVLDLQVQWTVFQFGKRLAIHDQATMQQEIVRWQFERARQSVEFDVALNYARVLQAQATRVVAENAVIRALATLRDVVNLTNAGVLTQEDVLRAEVFLADVRQQLITATSDAQIAVATLNRSMGINVSNPTRIVERSADLDEYPTPLEQCLDQAVAGRPEFTIIQLAVAAAGRGADSARADYLPTISTSGGGSIVEGAGVQNARIANGGIFVRWNLFDGGRRRAEVRGSDAQIQLAIAQGQQVCDTIAYETHVAFRNIEDAVGRLKQARTAVSQAVETLRLVRNRYNRGDAKPTDIVDAETALIRAQQNVNSARYDLLIALARMEFATGGARQPALSDQPRREFEELPMPREVKP
jgi:outer membrane protein TolC